MTVSTSLRPAAAVMAAVSLCAAAPAEARDGPWFRDVTAERLPAPEASPRQTMDAEAADLDGDGDLDLVTAQEFQLNVVLINQGGGRFEDASRRLLPPLDPAGLQGGPTLPGHDSEDVSIADFDGDGRLDLIIVQEDDVRFGRKGVHEHYRGLPSGGFERVKDSGVVDTEANAVAHADVTGDGRADLLIVGAGQDRLLVNDGRGRFRDETEARLPREAATGQDGEFADLDRDGDLDLTLGLEGGHALWINDGRGRFEDQTKARLPVAGFIEARKVTIFDADGDRDPDLFFSHVGWQGRDPADRLFLNDGRGRFTDASDRLPPAPQLTLDAKAHDFDGDGDLDLLRGGWGALQALRNDGGRFVDVSATALAGFVPGPVMAIETADFDGDGIVDLFLGMRQGGPNQQPPATGAYDRLMLGTRR